MTDDPFANKLFFTVEETAALLGVSRNTAYSKVRSGDIPSVRIGRVLRIPAAALRQMSGAQSGAQSLLDPARETAQKQLRSINNKIEDLQQRRQLILDILDKERE
jgi:excisionase family DNA binding protein